MKRRDFLQKIAAGSLLLPSLTYCTSQKRAFTVQANRNSSPLAHRLISKDFPSSSQTRKTDVLIVGAGVAGLTLGWQLSRQGFHDFELVEVGETAGGNAAYGQNAYTKYPWAAHYLPVADTCNKELLAFLEAAKIITGYERELPIYKEEYLNFAPQEALWIHRRWQEGLLPHASLSKEEHEELHHFFTWMNMFKSKKGKDGHYFFTVPRSIGSQDKELDVLDNITFSDFIQQSGYKSPFLVWYLNYCCQDEYGAPCTKVSAWAGIHYFASRRAMAANCPENHYLVWPEGNGFLTDALAQPFLSSIRNQHICFDVQTEGNKVVCMVFDAQQNTTIRYEAKKCVVCTPLFVTKRLLVTHLDNSTLDFLKHLEYYPWLTANIVFNKIKSESPAWDNVFYGNASLGLVYAQHQSLLQYHEKKTFTFYKNLSTASVQQERAQLHHLSEEALVDTILHDIRDFYYKEEDIESIHYHLIGHGMICPLKGVAKNKLLLDLQQPIDHHIYLAHSDLSGYSVFEEAFDHGTRVANEIVKSLYL